MWWLLLSVETIAICAVVCWLLRTYAAKDTSKTILWMTGFGWGCCFFIVVLVPSDIATYIHNHTENTDGGTFVVKNEDILINMWRIVYWVTFFGCWIVLPVTQAYHEAGEFTPTGRLKAALIENIVFYLVAAVLGIGFVAYIATVHNLTGEALTQFLMALANAWGLTLLVICLGYGLVEIPKKLMRQTNETRNLRYLQFRAIDVYEGLKEAQLRLKESAQQLHRANESLQDPELMPFMDTILAKCPAEYLETAAESEAHRNRRRDDDPDLSYKGLVTLHKNVKDCAVAHRRHVASWDELCLEAWETEDVIDAKTADYWSPIVTVGTSHRTGVLGNAIERAKHLWKVRLRVPFAYAGSVIATILSCGILWLELTIPIPSETMRLSWLYYVVHSTSGIGVQILAGIPFIYMSLCTYYSLFCLKVFNFYALHPNQQTEGPSLLFNAALLCRLVAPLSFNFLQCIDESLESSYQKYMGAMDTVPVLGEKFNLYVPIFISVFVLCTACNLFYHLAKCCPGVQQFSFQSESDDQGNIEDGQNMLQRERASRERKYAVSLEARAAEFRTSSSSRRPSYDKVATGHSDMDTDDDWKPTPELQQDSQPSLFDNHAQGTSNATKKGAGRSALEKYYKELDAKASSQAAEPATHKPDRVQVVPYEPEDDPVDDDTQVPFQVPNIMQEASPASHQFGARPHQFGGGSSYSFGGGVS